MLLSTSCSNASFKLLSFRIGSKIQYALSSPILPVETRSFGAYKAVPQSATYYVSPTGSDANPGTANQPWRTIQKAADTLIAGDTVYIKSGTYSEQVVPKNSGNADNYITYAVYPGDTATIDGSSVSAKGGLFGLFHIFEKVTVHGGDRIVNPIGKPNHFWPLRDIAPKGPFLLEKCKEFRS